MRAPIAPGPIDTLEEAFDLLERAPAAVWLRYLAGAGPLILGLLMVWSNFSTQFPNAASRVHNPVIAALFLVVLLVWFYRSRQVFAGHLRRIIGITRPGPAPQPKWSLACFEGTKLLAMPVAVLSMVPLAVATAFYRTLTLFAGEGLEAREAAGKAWKAAPAWQRENWFLLGILTIFGVAVFADIGVMVVLAPMLVKMFTGYESVFLSVSSPDTLAIEFPIMVALTWLAFDPLLQAVYVVRAFRWEGMKSGEDLLVRLQRLAPMAVLAICASAMHLYAAAPALTPDNLNQSIDQTLASPDYDWRIPPPETADGKQDWFLDTVDRVVALIRKGWRVITDVWSDLLNWIGRMLRPFVPAFEKMEGGKPSAVKPVFYVIGIAIVALAVVLVWKFGLRQNGALSVPVAGAAIDLNNENLLASDLAEDQWMEMADRYAGAGDLRLALRALYLAALAMLNRRGFVTLHLAKSNRDYERELRRRARDAALSQVFHANVRSFEQSWYGFHEVTGEQLEDFRGNLGRLRA